MPHSFQRVFAAACLIAVPGFVIPGLARADAIYGCWMFENERLTVEYERVITPGGASPTAEIDRHSASYVAPEGERDAGRRLLYRQLNDLQVARGVLESENEAIRREPEIWTPCRETPTS